MNASCVVGFTACFLLTAVSPAEDTNPGVGKHRQLALNVVFGRDPGRGKYDGVVGKPHDHWNLVDVGQTSIPALVNRKGARTRVSFQLSPNDGEWGIQGQAGVYHAYLYHNCRCVDLKATLKGLAPGRYKIYVYAHGDAPNQNAEVELAVGRENYGRKATLNDGSWDYRSQKYAEGVQYVSFTFVVEEGDPVSITSRRAGSTYSMFNAMQIVPIKN